MSILGAINYSYATTSKNSLACKTSPTVVMNTNMGNIQIQLDTKAAPTSVANFLKYANSGFYNGKIFHRVIEGFMIQGGGFDKNMVQAPTNPPIKNEADNGLTNDKYTIAMARTADPDSATSQFFINVANNDQLNFTSKSYSGWGYAVFGKVTKGTDVVDKIATVPTKNVNMYQNVPVTPIVINSVKLAPCN